MCRYYVATLVAVALVGGCSRHGGQQANPDLGPEGTPFEGLVIGRPVTHGNLAIFPIVSKTARTADRYITLDEGLAAGTVKIVEVGTAAAQINPPGNRPDDAQAAPVVSTAVDEDPFGDAQAQSGTERAGEVNRLMVLNTSGRPLYLMPGEVISGGNQDRTIGEELVIESTDKPVPIDVFCVEHARWSSRSVEAMHQLLADLSAHDYDVPVAYPAADMLTAKEATKGRFVAGAGQASKDLRLAIQQSEDQGKVWDEVAQLNSLVGSETETGTFVAAYASDDVNQRLKPFVQHLIAVGDTKRIVGVAVCVNGKMCSADVFESTPLFRKFWPKLLKSYALDAIAENDAPQTEPCSLERCVAFLKETAEAAPETKTADNGRHDRRETDGAISFSYYNGPEATAAGQPAGGMGGGMMGGQVHSGVLAK